MTTPNADITPTAEASTSGIRQAPLTGHRLGRYDIGERLGAGGAASVYLALLRGPHEWERTVALKVVHEHLLEQHDFVSMFLDEANLAVRLAHPNVVHSYELGHEGAWLFLAMEYLHGQPLSALIARSRQRGEPLPLDLMAWVGAEAAQGLAHAHDLKAEDGTDLGVVHRDVSPHNVFLTYDGQVKLIDFGIARSTQRITETGLGQVKGKFRYMAPEQLLGKAFDHRADIFALGATIYEATVGQRPFPADDEAEALASLVTEEAPRPETIRPDYPRALGDVLARALAREPENRQAHAQQLAQDLKRFALSSSRTEPSPRLSALLTEYFSPERIQQEEALERLRRQRPESSGIHSLATERPPTPTARPRRSRYLVTAAAGATVLAAAGALASGALFSDPPPEPPPVWVRSEAPATPPDQRVTIDVTVQPKVPATISIGGEVLTERPARMRLSPDSEPVPIVVTAEGYETARLEAVPDRDHFIVVPLIRQPAPVASSKPVPSVPPSGAPKPKQPAERTVAPSPPPESPTTRERPRPSDDPLVTDYPF